MTSKKNRLHKNSKKTKRKLPTHTSTLLSSTHLKECSLIIVFAIAVFFLISLVSYSALDPGWSRTAQQLKISNMAGSAGAWCADLFLYFFGIIAYFFPVMLIYGCLTILLNKKIHHTIPLWCVRSVGFVITLLSACGIISLLDNYQVININSSMPVDAGGVIGAIIGSYFAKRANFIGAVTIFIPCILAGLTAMTGVSWLSLIRITYYITIKLSILLCKNSTITVAIIAAFIQKKLLPIIDLIANWRKKRGAVINHKLAVKQASQPKSPANNTPVNTNSLIPNQQSIAVQQAAAKQFIKNMQPSTPTTNADRKTINNNCGKNSKLPAINLLQSIDPESAGNNHNNLPDPANIQEKLADFGISVQIANIFPGPVVTRIEMELAPGTKASKITSLSKDLARSLSVPSVRVVEVIPGKSVVGLEIPNVNRALVGLQDILSSEQYMLSNSPLTLALGKDISGIPIVADLARMPHLLVAGTTGSGKSVGVNTMLLSILFKSTAEDVRLILIDPKMLELSIYDGIPHLLTPVVTDMKDAANALNWCVFEMEKRYKLMASVGVRNVISFNHKIQAAVNARNPIEHPFYNPNAEIDHDNKQHLEKLPYIVVIIDEFADMMMVVGKKVEEQISRLAQKARAAGIHMILATQRPSVDVITGLIKANIPTRIAYQVSSRIDSRTILDQQGAEQLLGNGDLLYLPPGSGVPIRVHGSFVSDEEVHKVVTAIKESNSNAEQEATDIVNLSKIENFSSMDDINNGSSEELDPLYDQAVAIVTASRKASISYLQRRLKIGFNRAARLVEELEKQQVIITNNNGTKEVIAPPPRD